MTTTPVASLDTATLYAAMSRGERRAQALQAPVLVTVSFPTTLRALDLFAAAAQAGECRAYWERRVDRVAITGIGEAWSRELSPSDRPEAVAAEWRGLTMNSVAGTTGVGTAGPILMGGMAFDPHAARSPEWSTFPPAAFVLPRFTVVEQEDGAALTVNVVVSPDTSVAGEAYELSDQLAEMLTVPSAGPPGRGAPEAQPPAGDEAWIRKVRRVTAALRDGVAEKVVLARSVEVEGVLPPHAILASLRDRYPDCVVFALERGGSCFLGATPERLVALNEGTVRTAALAGSAPRGATPEQDEHHGAVLLASDKDRREHDVVLRMISDTLRQQCRSVFHPEAPRLLKLDTVQHLYTPVTARARDGQNVLGLAAALHPTPAVSGYPRAAALQLIRDTEDMDRGWYAGALGWMSASGEGEFVVGIRSGLYRDGKLRLYAGCGIMPDSDPHAEYEESEVKLQALRGVLAETPA